MAQYIAPSWTTGDRLRKARTDRGISVAEMASHLGVDRNTITNYEGDKNLKGVPLAVIYAYAERTRTPVEWLLESRVDLTASEQEIQRSVWTDDLAFGPWDSDDLGHNDLSRETHPAQLCAAGAR